MSIARDLADLFQTNGRIGIGTHAPSNNIHILGSNASPNVGITLQSDDTADATASINLMSRIADNTNKTVVLTAYRGNLAITGDPAAGNVGIGTSSPSSPLHITKSIATTYTGGNTGISNSLFNITNTLDTSTVNAQANIQLGIYDGTYNRVTGIAAVAESTTDRKTSLVFWTDDNDTRAEKLRITGDGNVGIGTNAPVGKLEVNDGTGNTFRAIRYEDHLMEIGNYNASDGYRATFYGSNEHRFMTATAGAGSGSVDMTITDGKVGIGVASPGTRLQVAGTQNVPSGTSKGMLLVRADGSSHGLQMGVNSSAPWGSWIQAQDNNISSPYPLTLQPGGGNVGIGTTSPSTKLQITNIAGNDAAHASYGHPNMGGVNGALYIDSDNSRFDWSGGIVFAGEGTTWSARFTAHHGLNVGSDTDGEIFGVHPVEDNGTTYSHTAAADSVTAAYLRVMGNGKTFVDKLYAEDAFVAPSHASDGAANTAGANVAGSIYFSTSAKVHRSYNGTAWSNVGVAPISESVFDAFGDGSALCLLKANNFNLDTGGSYNANLVGGVTYTTTAKFGSHSFNAMGNGTYFDIPSLPMVETVSFWYHCVGNSKGYLVDFRHDAPNNGRSYLYTHIGGGDQNINMGNDTTTTNRTGVIYIDGVQFSSGQYNFTSGVWYHIVIVRNGTDTHRTWDQGLRFGNRSDGTTEGNAGYFDQIRVFNRQLSAAEALALYNEIA